VAWTYLVRSGLPEFLQGLQQGLTKFLPHTGGRDRRGSRRGTGSAPGCGEESPVDGQQIGDTMQFPGSDREPRDMLS